MPGWLPNADHPTHVPIPNRARLRSTTQPPEISPHLRPGAACKPPVCAFRARGLGMLWRRAKTGARRKGGAGARCASVPGVWEDLEGDLGDRMGVQRGRGDEWRTRSIGCGDGTDACAIYRLDRAGVPVRIVSRPLTPAPSLCFVEAVAPAREILMLKARSRSMPPAKRHSSGTSSPRESPHSQLDPDPT